MKITARNRPDKFNFVLVMIDFLLYFSLGFVLFFIGPLFILIFLHRRGNRDVSKKEIDLLTFIFDNKKGNTSVWLFGAAMFGVLVATIMVWRKIKKKQLISIELTDETLLMVSVSLDGKSSIKEIQLHPNCFKVIITRGNEEADPIFELKDLNTGQLILSTKKDKYWEYKYDIKKLLAFREELENRKLLV